MRVVNFEIKAAVTDILDFTRLSLTGVLRLQQKVCEQIDEESLRNEAEPSEDGDHPLEPAEPSYIFIHVIDTLVVEDFVS